jgi:hypothetical protein
MKKKPVFEYKLQGSRRDPVTGRWRDTFKAPGLSYLMTREECRIEAKGLGGRAVFLPWSREEYEKRARQAADRRFARLGDALVEQAIAHVLENRRKVEVK